MSRVIMAIYRPFARIYRAFFPVQEDGVLGIIECEGEILLVKNSFGSRRWTLPGGGVKEGEDPREALLREVKEELGVVPQIGNSLGYLARPKGIRHTNYLRRGTFAFKGNLFSKEIHPDHREILEAHWFKPDELPEPMTEIARRVLELEGRVRIGG